MWSPIEERMMPERGDRLPEQRSLLDWLEEDVDQEELAAGEAKIEAAVEKARQAAPEAGNGTRAAPAASKTPMRVDAVSRPDLLLPVVQSVREHPAKEAAQLAFGGLSEGRDDLAEAQLPLLPGSVGPRVPLLDLVDFRGGPIMARGRGAPLDLRLLVAACIMSPHDARKSFLALAVSVRLLRDFCFPNGWERRRHWPAIRRALWKARDYVIPNGRGGWNLPFLLAEDPGRDAALDDQVVLIVKLPRGSGDGPVIRPPRARPAWRRECAPLPGLHRGPFRRLATGRYPPTPPAQPERPPVELRPRALPGPDGSRPEEAGVRCPRQEEPPDGRPRDRVGEPAGHRDFDPGGHHAGRPEGLGDRPRGSGRCDPEDP